jgi:eukaryotic-like serine/threonine-protein kinase
MTLSMGTRLGPYEILSLLGVGGMGEVYRALDTKLHRDVAIKVMSPAFAADGARLARFRREAQVLASLNHPNIAAIYGLDESNGIVALALELVDGEDLAERLKRGALVLDETVRIAKQIIEGLEAAHERGVVHRDLKPANIKLTKDGSVKILDFGLAKENESELASDANLSQSPTMSRQMTEAGVILGSAAYMSPEQARGKPVDRRADIWAYGVVLFEMLSGRRPFEGDRVTDTLASVLRQEIPWSVLPAATPDFVRRLLGRCLERDPRRRLQAIGEARIALEDGSVAPLVSPTQAPGKGRLFRILPWLLAAAVTFAAAWVLSTRGAPGTRPPEIQRFDVTFPADVEPVPAYDGGFALSPDGRVVAMVGVRHGARSLFVRRLESEEVLEITEPGSVNGASFSPDGTKLAILGSDGRVTQLSLLDRQRTIVATNADQLSGIAWGERGIVFSRDGVLWIAPSGGGDPRALTTLDAARHEVLHASPIFLPRGDTVLFSSLTAEPGTERIESVSVNGGGRRVVVERATTPVWAPTGHLLFARDGAVLATPFDEDAVQARGVAVPVLPSGVVATFNNGCLGFRLAASGTLLFLPRDSYSQRLVSVARDGSAFALDLPLGTYLDPRLSPDHRRVSVERDWAYIDALDLERGTRAQLAAARGLAWSIWNRDGSRIAFRRLRLPFWTSTDGSDQQHEVKGEVANDSPTAPGPDADSVLVTRRRPQTSQDVFLLSLSGAFAPRPLVSTSAFEGGAELSPDSRWLAYVSNESGPFEIYLRRFPDLDRQWQVSEGGGTQLRWSASGREIYYRNGTALMAARFDGSRPEPTMGKPLALFRDEYNLGLGNTIANYDVTPDGRFLMLRREAQGGHLRIVLNWTEELKQTLAKAATR